MFAYSEICGHCLRTGTRWIRHQLVKNASCVFVVMMFVKCGMIQFRIMEGARTPESSEKGKQSHTTHSGLLTGRRMLQNRWIITMVV